MGGTRPLENYTGPFRTQRSWRTRAHGSLRDRAKENRLSCKHAPVSVIIPTIGQSAYLRACVQSVLDQHCDRLEILVVLSGNVSESLPQLTGMPVRLVREIAPGVSCARNAGVKVAQGEIIACLDDDVIAAPGWAHAIVEGFGAPEIVCVAGRVVPDGAPYHAPEHYVGERMMSQWTLSRADRDWVAKALDGETGAGCNMAFRRGFVERTLFPLGLGAGSRLGSADESYMFFEVVRQGYTLLHTPDAIVTHHFGDDDDTRRRLKTMLSGAFAFHLAMMARYSEQRWEFFRELRRRLWRGVRMASRRNERNVVTMFSLREWLKVVGQALTWFLGTRRDLSLQPAVEPQKPPSPKAEV